MLHIPRSYQWPVGLALALHMLLFLLFIIDLPKSVVSSVPPSATSVKVVHAVALSQTQLEQQIKKVTTLQRQQKAMALARQKRLREQALAAKQRRLAEAKKQADLKAKQAEASKRQLERQKALKIQQAKEQKAKEQKAAQEKALAHQRAEQQKKQLAAEKKRKADLLAAEKHEKEKQKALQQQQLQKTLRAQQLEAEHKALLQARAREMQGIIDQYKGQILQAIQEQWILPDAADKEKTCVFLIHLGPGGAVISVKLLRSSGDAVLDRSAEMAVFKASPLPVPEDPAIFNAFRELRLTVRPETIASGLR